MEDSPSVCNWTVYADGVCSEPGLGSVDLTLSCYETSDPDGLYIRGYVSLAAYNPAYGYYGRMDFITPWTFVERASRAAIAGLVFSEYPGFPNPAVNCLGEHGSVSLS